MKKSCIFAAIILFTVSVFSVNAADTIFLKDGTMIQAKVLEISSTEIKYKRADHLDGPMIVISTANVQRIGYENGRVDTISADANAMQPVQRGTPQTSPQQGGNASVQSNQPDALQRILNSLPAVPIAGNNLKFEFGGESWVAKVNGESFSKGTLSFETTAEGVMLTLNQTHIWPGAVGRTAGRVANMIPGGGAVGGALSTAGNVAERAGPIETSGTIVLEYRAGPPARLTLVRNSTTPPGRNARAPGGTPSGSRVTVEHPLVAQNRFDLDGFNVFAVSISGIPTFWWGAAGAGITITAFEGYEPDAFFTPSYFISGKYTFNWFTYDEISSSTFSLSPGVLFRHRFPGDWMLWNIGASLEFMWVSGWGYSEYYDGYQYYRDNYEGSNFLFGMGIQTGFSFRFNPYTSLDINGLLKFPFGTMNMRHSGGYAGASDIKSVWPFIGGIELGITYWFPREQ